MEFARRGAAPAASPRRSRTPILVVLLAVVALAILVTVAIAALSGRQTTPAPLPSAVASQAPSPAAVTSPRSTPSATPAPQLTLIPLVPAPPAAPATVGEPTTALTAAHSLPVKGRAPRTGYARDLFGSGWVDTDRNGCDTRNDILARDLTATTIKPGTNGCVVLTGLLEDPYSGKHIEFVRGNTTSNDVQIDHVVALGDAWQKGVQAWDPDTRVRFANDPLNLLAVSGAINQQKADGDTATWLPPNKPFRCAYVARQVAVKRAYGLWVTKAEQDAMIRVLATCPDEPLPTDRAKRPFQRPYNG